MKSGKVVQNGPLTEAKNYFSGGPKVGQVGHAGPKHAPGTPGIPKKFQVFPMGFHSFRISGTTKSPVGANMVVMVVTSSSDSKLSRQRYTCQWKGVQICTKASRDWQSPHQVNYTGQPSLHEITI